jgi:hypothetical protein
MTRRDAVKLCALGAGALWPGMSRAAEQAAFPVRTITRGPKHHWFGYYDKLQFDPTQRYVLGMEVGFEHRPPTADDEIRVGMVDLKDGDKWIDLGSSRAWGWQQGCMLQWVPGSTEEVIWNDRQDGQFVSHVLNVKTGKKRTLSKAVYALSPDGTWAIGTEFSRIQNLRPGYGYAGVGDPHENVKVPKDIGLYRVDLATGHASQLFSLADIAAIPLDGKSVLDNFHWFNHLLVNTDGTRFTFLNRWRAARGDRQEMASRGFVTRMFTANADGSDLHCIDKSGETSHFIWRDPTHITAYTKPAGQPFGFYVLEDKTGKIERIGEGRMLANGHQTYLSKGNGQDWILCDTYPEGPERLQTPYLFHVPSKRRIDLGRFPSPKEYVGEWRCDTHPRSSPDGNLVCIDSPHGGNGRQLHLIDVSGAS